MSYVLMRKNDECIKKDPPAEEHEKVQNAEQGLPALAGEVRTPGHRRDHRHGVKKENNVEDEGIGDRPVQEVLPERPRRLVRNPQAEAQSNQRPEATLLLWPCAGIG